MMTTTDPRVAAYLHRLDQAAAALPAERRVELVAEISEHIATRLAEPDASSGQPGGDPVERVLARLGEPEEIVAVAAEESDGVRPSSALPPDAKVAGGVGGVEAAALVLLLLGGFLVGVGWIAGVVLLWISKRWTVGEKLLGTLVWPGGLATPVLWGGLGAMTTSSAEGCTSIETSAAPGVVEQTCSGGGVNVIALTLFVLSLLAPIVVAVFLGRRASRR